MGDKSGIEWTDATWNPVTGCDKVSPGCDRCYAETIAHRFAGTKAYPNGFQVTLRPDRLGQPLRWRRPRRIFTNSMSDLFHDAIPDEYIAQVWDVMAQARQHTFQILTKRPGRMRSLMTRWQENMPGPLPNVWLGVSAEDQKWADVRIPILLDTPAAIRFVSAEPLLGPIDIRQHLTFECPVCYHTAPWTDGLIAGYDDAPFNEYWCQTCGKETELAACEPQLHWVIVGGESGHGARPMHPDWARRLRDQCTAVGVPYLFKQWGEYRPGGIYTTDVADLPGWPAMRRVGKKAAGRELDGRTWDQYPEVMADV